MWKIDAGALIEIEHVDHRLNAFQLHFQTQPVEVTIARFHDREMHVRRAVIAAHAARELVADGDAATANQIRTIDRNRSLLQPGRGHQRLPGRARRILSLNRPINQRLVRIVQQALIFSAAGFGRDSLRKDIRIESRRRSQRKNLAVVRIHGDDHATAFWRFAQLILGGLLKITIDGRHDVLARLRFDPLNFALNVAAAVNDYLAIAIAPAQVLIIDGL